MALALALLAWVYGPLLAGAGVGLVLAFVAGMPRWWALLAGLAVGILPTALFVAAVGRGWPDEAMRTRNAEMWREFCARPS